MKKDIIIFSIAIFLAQIAVGQEKDVFESLGESKSIYDLTLEELFNTNVSSVSKKSESLFEAPLSASVITKEEIKNSGATSIPEALRLMPGLIVREQTNGVYEVYVRGGENTAPYSHLPYFTNSTTLVMIDGRPVYNYLQGGTFWETLPVDLNDVERIELVRGAMAALYGPNAVSGVINIITRKPKNYTLYSVANAHYGTNNTLIANGSLGYKWNQKIDLTVSGNLQQRDRYSDLYYTYATNNYVKRDNIENLFGGDMDDLRQKFPHPEKALDKKGVNAFLNYMPLNKLKFEIAAGMENSWAQKVFSENSATPFSTTESQTNYGDFRIKAHNLSGQVSLVKGTQSPALSTFGLKYDMSSLDAVFEYDFIFGSSNEEGLATKNFGEFNASFLPKGHSISVRPGFNYRKAIYDDTPYFEQGEGFINAKGELTTTAISMKFDYDILKKFRFTAALRSDQHNYPNDKSFLSYQTSAKYHINSRNIIRATYSRAYRSVYIIDTYSNFSLGASFPKTHPIYPMAVYPGVAQYLMQAYNISYEEALVMAPNVVNTARYAFTYEGNRNLDLLKVNMFELGFRSRLSENIALEIEGFNSITDGFVYPLTVSESVEIVPISETQVDLVSEARNVNRNYPQELQQTGVTLSINYYDNNLQIKPYLTWQISKFKKFTQYVEDLGFPNNEVVLENREHHGTPKWFGGAYVNYKINKLNINLNSYYMSKSELIHDYSAMRGFLELPIEGVGHMYNDSKILINAKIGYQVCNSVNLFVSGKNITASKKREFFFTDEIPASVLIGINFAY